MKKGLKIAGIVVAIVLALLIILPVAFKGNIEKIVKNEINENLNAKVDFGTFRISLIRNFPNVSLRLNDLSVVGVDEFEDIRLADIGSFFVAVDVMSFIRGDTYQIRSIRIDEPDLNIIVLEDGTANWDIIIPPEEIPEEEEEEEETEPFEFNLALQSFEIRGANIIYDDADMDVYVNITDFNHRLRGDFTADFATLSITRTTAESLTFRFENIPFIYKSYLDFNALIEADFSEQHFTFKNNELALNDLSIGFDGYFAMPPEKDMEMDISFFSNKTDIRSFISMVPAIYAKDFESIETAGEFVLNGYANGILSDGVIPAFGLSVLLEDGEFSYPDLPEAVKDIQINASVTNEGEDIDKTIVNVSQFSLNMADNPVSAWFKLETPISDPQFDFAFNCDLDLKAVETFFPLKEDENIEGRIRSDLMAKGNLSAIENNQFDKVTAEGSLIIENFEYKMDDLDDIIQIREMTLGFSPRYVDLSSFDCRFGETHILSSGRIDNIFGHLFDDQLLKGAFNFKANYIDLNQFMAETPEEPEEEIEPSEPMELSIIKVPDNIDFVLKSKIDQLLFGTLDVTNIIGTIRIVDSEVRMDNLRMNLLGGSLTLNGGYATPMPNYANVDFLMAIERFDIRQTYNTFNMVQILAPVGEYADGSFSSGLGLNSRLDNELNPVLETLEGEGNLSAYGVKVEGHPAIQKIADELKIDKLKTMELDDFSISFAFKDGKLEFDPYDINFGNYSATIEGKTYFDQRIDYNIGFVIPRDELGEQANQVMSGFVSQASDIGIDVELDDKIEIDAYVAGTFMEPKISLGLSEMMKTTADEVREQLKERADEFIDDTEKRVREETEKYREEAEERVSDVIEDKRKEVSEELERRAEKVVEQSHEEAERIRRTSQQTAQKIRDEARQQAERLENEASGRIAKEAARRSGEELIKEADQRADNIEKEGEQNAQRIIEEAENRADRIRKEEE